MRDRTTVGGAAALWLMALLGWSSVGLAQGPAPSSDPSPDPIAFIGHGVMFDESNRPIEVTPEFIEKAQAHYIQSLSARLPPAQAKRFDAERSRYAEIHRRVAASGQAADRQDSLVINAALIDWLIRAAPRDDAGALQGKNNLIKARLRYRLVAPEIGALYAAPQELMALLKYQAPGTRQPE
ncbi:hypothetical protein AACH06_28870 [Ideonella sp. DXS29W]|uniref:Peptidylprolyl isomerase n=1 Tax=Ideonella lacteola TaxID=2984193 RepID=A0ABU9C1X7_9BURK